MTERAVDGPVRVLTVDDYRPFLTAVARVIAAAAGFESAGEVADASDAFEVIDILEPQLALIDVYMHDIGGIEVSRRIAAEHPRVLVVLISTQALDQLPAEAYECGAAAIVRKQDLNPRFLEELWRDLQPA
jgi:two-component system, NarL family, invasion response regulator UvrY